MKKRLNFIALCGIVLLVLLSAAGCQYQSASAAASPTNTAVEPQSIINNTISALSRVNTYQLNTNLINSYNYNSNENSVVKTYDWSGTKYIDLSRNELEMNMLMYSNLSDTIPHINYDYFEMYLVNGWQYIQYNQTNTWTKQKPAAYQFQANPDTQFDIWNMETQIPYYIELLKTATHSSISGSETLNGVDYYILNLTPDTGSIVDWVLSQNQPSGRLIGAMQDGIAVERPDAYQGSSVRLWINKTDFLLFKAEINVDFYGSVGVEPFSTPPATPTGSPVNSSFNGQATFSDYNQPVSIQVPHQALEATQR